MRWFEVLAVVVALVTLMLRQLGHWVSWIFIVPAVGLTVAAAYVRLVVAPPEKKAPPPR